MKKRSILLAMAAMMLSATVHAQENTDGKNIVTVDLTLQESLKPGILVEKLGENRYEIDSLVMTGVFEEGLGWANRDVEKGIWATLRDCCRHGRLRGIDLSGSSFNTIPYYAFTGSSPFDRTPIQYVTLPEGKRIWIGQHAFANTELRWINLTEVGYVEDYAFVNSDLDGEFDFSEIGTISSYAFAGCKLRGTLNLENVGQMGEGAFEGANYVEKVILSASEQIPDYAFYRCDRLQEVVIPEGVRKIGRYAFRGDVRSISLPSTIEYIGEGALHSSHLESLTIPEKVMELFPNTFFHSYIKEIQWPSYIKKIGTGCFIFNEAIEELELPDCIMDIDSLAFFGNIKLKKVILPENLQHLGLGTFANCTELSQVVAKSPVPPYTEEPRVLYMELGRQVSPFNNIMEDAVLYVPQGAKEAYEQAEYWRDFKTIIELEEGANLNDLPIKTGIEQTIADDSADAERQAMQGIYTLHGVKVDGNYEALPRGMYIINGRKVVK